MQITKTNSPCDRIESDMLAFGLFTDKKDFSKNALGLTDWRLNGFISKLFISKKLTAENMEKTLLATNGKMKSKRVLILGLGKSDDFDRKSKTEYLKEVISQAENLNCKSLTISLEGTDIPFETAKSTVEKLKSELSNINLLTSEN